MASSNMVSTARREPASGDLRGIDNQDPQPEEPGAGLVFAGAAGAAGTAAGLGSVGVDAAGAVGAGGDGVATLVPDA